MLTAGDCGTNEIVRLLPLGSAAPRGPAIVANGWKFLDPHRRM